MSRQHPRPWHRGSEFGDGLRWPLDREARCVWRVRLDLARRAGRITALHELIGLALLRRLGKDGRCDPAQDTIAADVGCCPRTVGTALAEMRELGMLGWIRRLVRVGDRVRQTSNAYTLIVAKAVAFIPRPRRKSRYASSDGKTCRETNLDLIQNSSSEEKAAAIAALARIRQLWEGQRAGGREIRHPPPRGAVFTV